MLKINTIMLDIIRNATNISNEEDIKSSIAYTMARINNNVIFSFVIFFFCDNVYVKNKLDNDNIVKDKPVKKVRCEMPIYSFPNKISISNSEKNKNTINVKNEINKIKNIDLNNSLNASFGISSFSELRGNIDLLIGMVAANIIFPIREATAYFPTNSSGNIILAIIISMLIKNMIKATIKNTFVLYL